MFRMLSGSHICAKGASLICAALFLVACASVVENPWSNLNLYGLLCLENMVDDGPITSLQLWIDLDLAPL